MPPATSRHNAPGMALLLFIFLFLLHFADSTAARRARSPAVSCAATTSLSDPCFFPSGRSLLPGLLAAKMGLPPPPLVATLNGTATDMASFQH
ncbi:hypothetical protein ACP70R_046882 [Stipagrostis hirtigluma subsp. patula]